MTMYKVQISVKNFFRDSGEPAFNAWEDLKDRDGNLILLTEEDVKIDSKPENQIESMRTRYIPVSVAE